MATHMRTMLAVIFYLNFGGFLCIHDQVIELHLNFNVRLVTTCYFYVGYDGSANEWEDYNRYVNQEGLDVTPVSSGDVWGMCRLYLQSFSYFLIVN